MTSSCSRSGATETERRRRGTKGKGETEQGCRSRRKSDLVRCLLSREAEAMRVNRVLFSSICISEVTIGSFRLYFFNDLCLLRGDPDLAALRMRLTLLIGVFTAEEFASSLPLQASNMYTMGVS